MSKAILYPFKIDQDFRVGYAWSAELARRLNRSLALFTTVTPSALQEPTTEIYSALAEAQGYYVKSFQLLEEGLKPVISERNFLRGEFSSTLLDFIDHQKHGIVVVQSGMLESDLVKKIIKSGVQIIVLASDEVRQISNTSKDRSQLFLTLLRHSACYNLPESIFNALGQDKLLFNSLASFFRK